MTETKQVQCVVCNWLGSNTAWKGFCPSCASVQGFNEVYSAQGAGARYRLTRDCLYVMYFAGQPLTCTLNEGEVCEYFAHSDTYIFEHRDSLEGARIAPYYTRNVVESWGFWFEILAQGEKQ